MSITDELRKWGRATLADTSLLVRMEAIADRIDAAVERMVELPKDADGEYIRIGDVMEGVDKYDSLKKVTGEVTTISFDATFDPDDSRSVGIRVWSDDRRSYHTAYLDPRASVYRHYHAPTVEDVLRDFAQAMNENLGMYTGEAIDADEWRKADERTIADYAAKLKMADA